MTRFFFFFGFHFQVVVAGGETLPAASTAMTLSVCLPWRFGATAYGEAHGTARSWSSWHQKVDASLAAKQYYAHPTNQFWRLVGGSIGEELQELPYEDRLQRLAERRIGLWDVIASASRRGGC